MAPASCCAVLLAADPAGRPGGRAGLAAISSVRAPAWRPAWSTRTAINCTNTCRYLRDPWNFAAIVEFLSPSFHHPTALFFEILLVLGAAAACWHLLNRRFTEPLLILLWAHAALLAVRNIPIFAIVAAPPVAARFGDWLKAAPQSNVAAWLRNAVARFNRIESETGETEAVGRWHLVSVAGILLVVAVMWAPHPPRKFRAEFDPGALPERRAGHPAEAPHARIFTNDEWGDYLIWSLYPAASRVR